MMSLNGIYKFVTAVVILSVGVVAAGAEAFSSDQDLDARTAFSRWQPDAEEERWLAAIPVEIQAAEINRRLERLGLEKARKEQTGFTAVIEQDITNRARRIRDIADLVPAEYRDMVLDQADRYGLDPRMLAAVVSVESQWKVRALGTHGDSGLMQIVPGTAEWIARRMGLRDYNLYNPETNLAMGAWYLQVLYSEYGTWPKALAAYNGGPKLAPLGIQHPYVLLVLKEYEKKGS